MHLMGTLVLVLKGAIYFETRKHYCVVKCTTEIFFVKKQKVEIRAMRILPSGSGRFIPHLKTGAFTPDFL